MLKLDTTYGFIDNKVIEKKYKNKVQKITEDFVNKKLPGNEFYGWKDLPMKNHDVLLEKISKKCKELKSSGIRTLLVIGIGGSYLGIRAMNDAINGLFPKEEEKVEIIYAGNTMSSTYVSQLSTLSLIHI